MWRDIALILAGFAVAAIPIGAIKQAHAAEITVPLTMHCWEGDHKVMEGAFYKWNEVPILTGVLNSNENIMYIFGNKNTGVWTLVLLGLNNNYCLIFAGEGLKPTKGEPYAQTH